MAYNFAHLVTVSLINAVLGQYGFEFPLSNVAKQFASDSGRFPSVRSGDPSRIVPHLYQGDVVWLHMCTDDWINVSFTNVTFSNDGSADTVTLSVDGLHVGQFQTIAHSDWGTLWNEFNGSGYIGHSGKIPPGKHKVEIRVTDSDCYGVELGTVYVQADKPMRSDMLWCGNGYEFAPTKLGCLPDKSNLHTEPPRSSTPVLPHNYVHVGQYSFKSDCLDAKNVRLSFRSRDLVGATITVSQVTPLAVRSSDRMSQSSGARFCKNRIWQLGEIDGDNKEFQPIYSGEKITINMTGLSNQEAMFPAKILPFATSQIVINFNLPEAVHAGGSAFFVLGLVNVTKKAEIGLQYYDHTKQAFSDIHYITFNPTWRVSGWSIPDLGRVLGRNNTFKLHFISESNIIMFDFLKLEYYQRDERKHNILLYQGDKWKIRGLRYSGNQKRTGPNRINDNVVDVIIDSIRASSTVEELVIFYRIYPFRHYQNILRIHSDGNLYLYRPYYINLTEQEKVFVDVSGFMFTQSSANNVRFDNPISSVHINTSSDIIAINYKDGSILHLRLIADISHTKIQIVNFHTERDQRTTSSEPTVIFTSTHVTDDLAAVNEISMDGEQSRNVMADMSDYGGGNFYTLRRSSQNNMYYANNILEVQFPK